MTSGFIAIVGRPNVGKSTLLNAILGEKVAIVSAKPQTTRNRITGIHTEGENQFVFLDTPGIHAPKNALGEYMVKTANSTMMDADVIVFVADASREPGQLDLSIVENIKNSDVPAILVLNKTDLSNAVKVGEVITEYAELKYRRRFYQKMQNKLRQNSMKFMKGEVVSWKTEESQFMTHQLWNFPMANIIFSVLIVLLQKVVI